MVRDVHEPLGLLLERHDHARVAVPQIVRRHTGNEVEVLPAVGIIYHCAAPLHQHQRLARIGVHEVFLRISYEVAGDHRHKSSIKSLKNQIILSPIGGVEDSATRTSRDNLAFFAEAVVYMTTLVTAA